MAVTANVASDAKLALEAQTRWHPLEFAFWAATLLPFLAAALSSNCLALASQIAITALFALSLDLILGYAGMVSLGSRSFFRVGRLYCGADHEGILVFHCTFGSELSLAFPGWREPLVGLLAASAVAGLAGYATSFIVARFRHLTLIMITLGIGFLLEAAANQASWLTGGSDGLQDINIGPLLGHFPFNTYGWFYG